MQDYSNASFERIGIKVSLPKEKLYNRMTKDWAKNSGEDRLATGGLLSNLKL